MIFTDATQNHSDSRKSRHMSKITVKATMKIDERLSARPSVLHPRVGGRLALFCIHCVNRVYGALVVTSWTCYGALQIVVSSLLLLLLSLVRAHRPPIG